MACAVPYVPSTTDDRGSFKALVCAAITGPSLIIAEGGLACGRVAAVQPLTPGGWATVKVYKTA